MHSKMDTRVVRCMHWRGGAEPERSLASHPEKLAHVEGPAERGEANFLLSQHNSPHG